jgi:DNA-binding protein H-NS
MLSLLKGPCSLDFIPVDDLTAKTSTARETRKQKDPRSPQDLMSPSHEGRTWEGSRKSPKRKKI